jgi:hypothetical protein
MIYCYADWHYDVCYNGECLYAECHNPEYHHAECHGTRGNL